MYLIVGLGNPGKKYEYTRHNFGFLVIRHLAEKILGGEFRRSSLAGGWTADIRIKGKYVCFLLPTTFMNNSGNAVRKIFLKKQVDCKDLLVVCDDYHLNFQQIRLRKKGSDGGHNGLASIIERLNTDQFSRLRLGIGSPPRGQDPAEYVLDEFSAREKKEVQDFIPEAAECCLVWLEEGVDRAMEKFNRKKENGE